MCTADITEDLTQPLVIKNELSSTLEEIEKTSLRAIEALEEDTRPARNFGHQKTMALGGERSEQNSCFFLLY